MHRPSAVLAVLALAALAALPLASAQGHAHDNSSGVVIAHDVPPDGRTYAGNINHFAVLDLGTDLVPDFHQQNHVRVTWNGLVLYETTPDSGHDYDGIHAFDIAFPGPGDYEVAAIDEAGKVLTTFAGYVVEPKAGSGARLELDGPAQAPLGTPVTFTFRTLDADGLVDHSDATFEVLRGEAVVFRGKTHTHEEDQVVRYAFPQAGDYVVRVTAFLSFPSGKESNDFAPMTVEHRIAITPGVPMPSLAAAPTPPSDMNAVAVGTTSGGDYTLVGTYDPYTQVGTNTLQHLTALVMDPATGLAVQHVDFTATLNGPLGVVFASDTLHEYDGLLEVASMSNVPGVYNLVLDAERGDWTGHVELPYTVLPPVVPVGVDVPPQPAALFAGLTVSGLDHPVAATPTQITIAARGLAGQPVPHSEIDVVLVDQNGVPVLATKLHTHSDGDFPVTLTFPHAGDFELQLSMFPLAPELIVQGGSLRLPLHADGGVALPADPTPNVAQSAQESPAPTLAWLALALGAALVARRR